MSTKPATDQASLLLGKQLKGGMLCLNAHGSLPRLGALQALQYSILKGCALCNPAELTKRPVDGFSAGLVEDDNLFEWQVTVMGPPDTL